MAGDGQIIQGLLGSLRTLSPNVKAEAIGNEIEILIPKEDVVEKLFSNSDPRIRSSMKVEIVPEGIKIKVRLL